jgi:hypothetical protein
MQDIIELTGIITPKKLEKLRRRHGSYLAPDQRVKRLYDLIAAGSVQTDEEAMVAIFGKNQKVKYRRLKIALREYLLQMLLFLDLNLPHFHERQTLYYASYKKWAGVKLLTGRGAHLSALEVSKTTLKQAEKFEFTDIAVDILRSLRLYYGSMIGDLKQFDLYKERCAEYEQIFHYENLAEELYTDLIVRYVNTKETQSEVHEAARTSFERLQGALDRYGTYRLHFVGRLLEVLIYTSINNYEETVVVCDKAIRFFEAKPYIATVPLQVFLYQEMVCYVQLRNYEAGEKAAQRGLQFLERGAFNWFKYQELLLLLSLHSGNYQRAYELYIETTSQKRFNTLPSGVGQIWKIFEAYLFFLIQVELVEDNHRYSPFSKFRMGRFVNEVPLYSKDKRGMNIPILIVQILYLIQQKREGEVVDRVEAIGKYISRYITKKDNYRSACFINMLLQIPANSFHRVAVERHTQKYNRMLESMPLDFARQAHDIEIIPYEQLWDMTLDLLPPVAQ